MFAESCTRSIIPSQNSIQSPGDEPHISLSTAARELLSAQALALSEAEVNPPHR